MHIRSLLPVISLFVLGAASAACKTKESTPTQAGSSASTGSGPKHVEGDSPDHGSGSDMPKGDGHTDHDHGSGSDTPKGDDHGSADHGGSGAAPAAPASLKDAVTQLDAAFQELAAIVKDGDLSKAHVAADRLAVLGDALPALATKAKLAEADVKAVTVAGKKLRLFFKDIDEAGDSGKRDAAQKAFTRYQEPIATIKAKAAAAK